MSRIIANGRGWVLPAAIALICLAAMIFGDAAREAFRYDRSAIGGGEVFRLISGHFVHLGASHTVLNMVGLIIVWALTGRAFSIGRWLIVTALIIAIIDAGFWLLLPRLEWYVGLSGLLHGMLVAGAVGDIRRDRLQSVLILIVVAGKLIYEVVAGPLPGSSDAAGGPVLTESHLYGAIGGLLAGAALIIRVGSARDI